MDDPPAPEIGDREGLLDPGQRDHAEDVEQRDIDGGCPEQVLEPDPPGPELPRRRRQLGAGRPQRAEHQQAPDHQAGEEADLPGAAELDVGQALIAEPEPAFADVAHDAEIIAGERADDDEQRHPEQQIDEEALSLRLAAADRRRQEQGRADPGEADPDDRRLDVDVAQEVERQEAIDLDAVKARPIRVVVGHDRADENLQQEDCRDHEKIFADPPLAGGQGREFRQHRVHRRLVGIVQIALDR